MCQERVRTNTARVITCTLRIVQASRFEHAKHFDYAFSMYSWRDVLCLVKTSSPWIIIGWASTIQPTCCFQLHTVKVKFPWYLIRGWQCTYKYPLLLHRLCSLYVCMLVCLFSPSLLMHMKFHSVSYSYSVKLFWLNLDYLLPTSHTLIFSVCMYMCTCVWKSDYLMHNYIM